MFPSTPEFVNGINQEPPHLSDDTQPTPDDTHATPGDTRVTPEQHPDGPRRPTRDPRETPVTVEKILEISSPQRMFVAEMRALREASGASRNKIAQSLDCTPQWLAKVESFEKPPSEALATGLDRFHNTRGTFRRLWDEFDDDRKRGLVANGARRLFDVEPKATHMIAYEPLIISGLVQTEEVVRRMHLGGGVHPQEAEDYVSMRMERQKKIFDRPDAPWLFLVMREAALRDMPRDLRAGQAQKLLQLLELSRRISIQIVPPEELAGDPSGFAVLSFPKEPDMAYIESSGRTSRTTEDPEIITRLTEIFNRLRSSALSVRESRRVIQKYVEST
ncbi:helix-turn-helix transcriptional regulator [Actinocorallia sp. A-T 12471]|uniref:helix-turn-helix domain-containing protein n=1 Tax=Actinocorallia sp. A-T 12471 TaxID=3089813 RepID=UPI0029D1F502|nr:helix-turn-helix transcriptional regulator [Actinocorallia sp. A-T 12471]MDX6742034.1 helix-turn-helix transcriptional regulator [Actinocorallia sp. A-T 12471]